MCVKPPWGRVLSESGSEIERLSRLYAALSSVNQAIVRMQTRDELFRDICRILVEQGGFRLAWIGWHVPEEHRLVPVAEWGDESGYLRTVSVYTDDRPEARGPTGTAFRKREPSVSNDVLGDPTALPWRPELERRRLLASAAFPIREQGRVSGALTVYAGEVGFFRDREVSLISEAAANVSFALDNLAREAARKAAETRVRQEHEFSDAVLSSLPGILYLYDRNGQFLRWNRNFERATGYTSAEIRTMQPLDFFGSADKELVAERIGEVFREGQSSAEAGLLSKDGRTTPYYFTGVLTELDGKPCLIGVGIDIGEQKRAEEARRASEGRYRTLFEHAPDGIVIADAASYYLDANASVCQMLGYDREELIGLHAADIVVMSEVPQIEPALDAIKGGSGYHREWQFRRKDGSTFPAEVIATGMPDGTLLGMIRDITQRKAAEKALRDLNETLELKVVERTRELQTALVRAEAADRLKSAFLATMSHELRTPLNSIIGFTGIVLQGLAGPLTPEQDKQLGMVRGSARHLLELINDVLDLSKIEAEQLEVRAEPFDLLDSLRRVIAMVKPLADKKGLALTLVLSPELTESPETREAREAREMVSDRRRVEQILVNLVGNAIKFTDHGGVTVTAEIARTLPSSSAVRSLPAMRLRVTDTGIGIAPEDLATLFRPFRQIDTGLARKHEGTGLGLAICRRLAALLGGEIFATSTGSKGSEFVVILPVGKAGTS